LDRVVGGGYLEEVFGSLRWVIAVPWSEVVLAMVAFLCGATIGIERERNDKPVGLRTLVLICVGSCVFTQVSMSPILGAQEPARIAAQIVTGVGFLGAGSIIREGVGVIGVTTAATVWITAGVGMVVGAGYATAGVALSLMILVTLVVLKWIEERLSGPCRLTRVIVRYRPDSGKSRFRVQQAIDRARGPMQVSQERITPGGASEITLTYCEAHREHRAVLSTIVHMPEVESVELAA
jgi:putative Mg2+ transporter-C (MgtC) family protein